ncbi:MAG TPA: PEP-CTERM sorting domain-containing protein [Roseateles sp.]
MPTPRLAVLSFSLAVAFAAAPAIADVTPPSLPLGAPGPSNFYGLELNQWYVFANHVTTGSFIDGATTRNGELVFFPGVGELSRSANTSQVSGSKLASAFARVAPDGLGSSASAHDALNPTSTWTGALGYAAVSYMAVLDTSTSIQFNLKLDGQLRTLGDRVSSTDGSGTAVAALAYGSQPNITTESQLQVFQAAGITPYADGDLLVKELSTLKSSTQTHLDAFGAQTDTVIGSLDVDTTLHVTAEGTRLDCDASVVSPACGRYFYMLNLVLFTGAQNGGSADFSHSLQISSYSVNGGPAQSFAAASPVPEPASATLLIAGLLAVGGFASRRRTSR